MALTDINMCVHGSVPAAAALASGCFFLFIKTTVSCFNDLIVHVFIFVDQQSLPSVLVTEAQSH